MFTPLELTGCWFDQETNERNAYSAEFPADTVHTLQTNDHVTVEDDGEVKTQ